MARLIVVLVLFIPFITWEQNFYYLNYVTPNSDFFENKEIQTFKSKEALQQNVKQIRYKFIKKGYVLASIDSIIWKKDTAFVRLYTGSSFENIHISYAKEDAFLIRKTPQFNERLIRNLPFNPKLIAKLMRNLLHYLNNNGYPFAKVYLKIKNIAPKNSAAALKVERGPLIRYKNVFIKGTSKIKQKYIQNAIAIKPGDLYDAALLDNISSKIAQIPFIKEIKPYEILFTTEGANLYLYAESLPISSIDGIVGLQPNPNTHKTTVTGDIQLKLINILKQGEKFGLRWQSLKPKTQDLNVQFQFPFLFNTPFGVNTQFQLHKEDSTYLNLDFHIGVLYYFSGGSYVKAFYNNKSSSLLSSSAATGNFIPISENSYGLGYYKNQVDYLPNPSKGFKIAFDLAAGRRKSKPNKDSTNVATTFSGNLQVEVYLPITPRNVIRLANTTKSYYAPKIFKNEMYQFGGQQKQRGFDEASLFATSLSTFTIEYRFLVDKNSHAFAFFDQTIYERNTTDYIRDTPFGFGLGYAFGTKIGIFSISYALGKQFNNPIQFREGKIHFGYIAFF